MESTKCWKRLAKNFWQTSADFLFWSNQEVDSISYLEEGVAKEQVK